MLSTNPDIIRGEQAGSYHTRGSSRQDERTHGRLLSIPLLALRPSRPRGLEHSRICPPSAVPSC